MLKTGVQLIIFVETVIFFRILIQLNVSFLNKSINFLKEKKKLQTFEWYRT